MIKKHNGRLWEIKKFGNGQNKMMKNTWTEVLDFMLR